MPDDVDISPLESNDVYTYDQQTATYQSRAVTAANNYRSASQYSGFNPKPAAPPADPSPSTEDEDVSPLESNKVGFYDGLTSSHRSTTATEVARFDDELDDYADDYEERTGQTYNRPQSQVQPMQITDGNPEEPMQSNLVGDYDSAASGYSGIATGASGRTDTQNSSYDASMASANSRFNALQGNNGTIANFESRLVARVQQMTTNVANGLIHIEDL